jgi:uncharacterized Ntn-hydrolase superfamily protein
VTFSLVGCDLEAREWGVAVASKFLAVGAVVPWARGDIGAVATQSYANVAYGPDGLALLASGVDAQTALDRLVAVDPGREERQAGIVDAEGRGATYTGSECFDWAGGRTGPCFAAQGNILTGPEVVDAMADTFAGSSGPLAERLLAALAAGDDAGGDRRGRQSASLIVRRSGGGYGGNNDILIDLRVDDHEAPITELSRIYALHDLMFGKTPEADLIPIEQVEAEVRERLAALGYTGDVHESLRTWASAANLEERLHASRVDPVVLRALREAGLTGSRTG